MSIKSEKELPIGTTPKNSNRSLETEDRKDFQICKTSNDKIEREFESNYIREKNA